MSYILDALKKSQQQRSETLNLPDSSAHIIATPIAAEKPHHSIFWLVLVLAVICAGLLVILVLPKDTGNNAQTNAALSTRAASKAALTSVPLTASPFAPVPDQQTISEQNAAIDFTESDLLEVQLPASAAPVVVVGAGIEPASVEPVAVNPTHNAAQAFDNGSVKNTEKNEAPTSQPLAAARQPAAVEVRSLPPLTSLRKVPALMITSHIYSSMPEKRSVTMNNRLWREGEPISAGVTLKEITPQGILLDVDGWPLQVNRQQGWQPIPTGN